VADKAWKAFERRIAMLFGTKRNGCVTGDGSEGSGSADLENDAFSVECKLLSRPTWGEIIDACNQSERNATPLKQPIAIIKKKGAGQETVVCMRLSTWLGWHL
jgi:hypothetical protein